MIESVHQAGRQRLKEGTIVVIFPDGGEKYMSTPLFDLPVGSMLDEIL